MDHSAIRQLPTSLIEEGLKRTTLEAETCGAFQPLPGGPLHAIAESLDPATSGIAIRVGDDWHVRFPSALRMTGSAATQSTLHELAAVAGLTPDELVQSSEDGRATIYRFDTIDLMQLEGDRTPRVFSRGNMQATWSCDRTSATELLGEIAAHLKGHVQHGLVGTEGIRVLGGDFVPHADRYAPLDANPRDKALFSWAMAVVAKTPGTDPTLAESAHDWSRLPIPPSATARDEIVASAFRTALLGEPSAEDLELLVDAVADADVQPATRAVAAWALAGHSPSHSALDCFLEEVRAWSPSTLMDMLPWLGWADMRVATSQSMPPRLADFWNLLAMRTMASVQDDVTPTADFLPLAAFLASVADDKRVIPLESQPAMIDAVCRSLTMLHQLVVGADESRFYRGNSRGGVRLALWNERMPIWAQCMAILVLTEAVDLLPDTLQREEHTP
jgi:hypothetical protein